MEQKKSLDIMLKNLPVWDLSDLYSGPEDIELENTILEIDNLTEDFHRRYFTSVEILSIDELADSIIKYEKIIDLLGKVSSYAQLYHSQNISNERRGRFYQNISDRLNSLSGRILFFPISINKLDGDILNKISKNNKAKKYLSWVRDLRVFKEYELDERTEKLIHEKNISARSAWIRLFDEVESSITCRIEGNVFSLTEALHIMSDPESNKRKKAAKAIGKSLGNNARTFTYITNVLSKDKSIEDAWRNLPRPVSSRNLQNLVEDEVVDSLIDSVKSSYASTSHRYYKLKAKIYGKEYLNYWDRNAPLPGQENSFIEWEEARRLVLEAYSNFHEEFFQIGKTFFDNGWIDASVSKGKASGAFSHPTVPSCHPYILLNYLGTTRDVMTLAHELGHGIHQVLSSTQGPLQCGTPLTLAETASVFGEMLTFQSLLAKEESSYRRRFLLAGKIEDILNTVNRQVSFHDFETRIHKKRFEGEIAQEEICNIWLEVQRDCLGPIFKFDKDYRYYWTYIGHFIHAPFYVYAYAFGDCLVNSLYGLYKSKIIPDFESKYIEMLKAGGSLRYNELLRPFGLDPKQTNFWSNGIKTVVNLIDELETVI